jgi:hypothetical protein
LWILPAAGVTWDVAHEYFNAVGLRLPTEAAGDMRPTARSTGAHYGNLGQIA